MKWQQDLTHDIRTFSSKDDIDDPVGYGVPYSNLLKIPEPYQEFTEINHVALQHAIDACTTKPKYFLEIGVCRNLHKSSTYTIFKNLPEDGIYLGVDLDDKSYLSKLRNGIHTIQESSSSYDIIINKLNSLNVHSLDFILIDGWHSINQLLLDWEYTKILSPGGVVGFHDVTAHPGPHAFINALDKSKWTVQPNLCPNDYGFGYCKLK